MNKFKGLLVSITPMWVFSTVIFLFFSLFPAEAIENFSRLKVFIFIVLVLWFLISINAQLSYVFPIPIMLLIGLMFLSAWWSQNPTQTLINSFFYFLLLAASITLASYDSLVRVGLSASLLILIALSFSAAMLDQDLIRSISTRDFPGIYSNNNGFAFVLISAFPALLSLQPANKRAHYLKFVTVVAVALLVIFSGSETELGALVATLSVWGIILFQKNLRVVWVILVPFFAVILLVLLLLAPDLLIMIGKDPTIAGRTTLWLEVVRFIKQSPMIGMGWTNSWPDNSALFTLLLEKGMPLHHAHNEFLNWLLTLGVIGLILVLWIYGSMIVGGVKLINSGEKGLGTWVTLTAVAFFVRGLSEISETNALGWFLWVVVYVSMMHAFRSNATNKFTFPLLPKYESYEHSQSLKN